MYEIRTQEQFERFCRNDTSEELDKYYKANKSEFIVSVLLFIFINVIAVLLYTYNLQEHATTILVVQILLNICLIFMFLAAKMKNNFFLTKSLFEKMAVFSSGSSKKVNIEKKVISEAFLNECEFFNFNKLKKTGDNFWIGNFHGLSCCDLLIYERILVNKKRKNIPVFDGFFYTIMMQKAVKNNIYVVPNKLANKKRKLQNYFKYDGKKLKLENLEFEKKYAVYCDDENAARYVLSLKLLEKINELDEFFPEEKIMIFTPKGRLVILFSNLKMNKKFNKIKFPFFRNENKNKQALENLFKFTYSFYYIYDLMDLGNELYASEATIIANSSNQNELDGLLGCDSHTEGEIINNEFGYSFKYNGARGYNEKEKTIYFSEATSLYVSSLACNSSGDDWEIIHKKISQMRDELKWNTGKLEKDVTYGNNTFVRVDYTPNNSTSRKLTQFYIISPLIRNFIFAISIMYYYDEIDFYKTQIEYILSNFRFSNLQHGIMNSARCSYEYNGVYKDNKNRIYLHGNIMFYAMISDESVKSSTYLLNRTLDIIKQGYIKIDGKEEREFGENKYQVIHFKYKDSKFFSMFELENSSSNRSGQICLYYPKECNEEMLIEKYLKTTLQTFKIK